MEADYSPENMTFLISLICIVISNVNRMRPCSVLQVLVSIMLDNKDTVLNNCIIEQNLSI